MIQSSKQEVVYLGDDGGLVEKYGEVAMERVAAKIDDNAFGGKDSLAASRIQWPSQTGTCTSSHVALAPPPRAKARR